MRNKIAAFLKIPLKTKVLYIEAYAALARGRLAKTKSNEKILSLFGTPGIETSFRDKVDKQSIMHVSHAIHTMADNAWWESECLVKAAAALEMLTRRNQPVTLYLGTGRDKDGKFVAHAWTRCGKYYVTGAEELEKYTVVMTYATDRAGKGDNNERMAD
ncbi:lasso peptide biosynthesis B2 protein [Alkalicoccus daliensis]|uniref:Transglutaminase-like superfamily protein n=1 Tax=Alkalicoccus daliensis TaxID=745820 RepID=A0A1H0G069_9BACI|nr:lasso peptide biosynthesis B2 protein [Alkalicoccus daliensis]SDO00242.1 Transglutaminase-like superfamily protein [Alkalicoccus daliensis]